jgi:hypothetical protein
MNLSVEGLISFLTKSGIDKNQIAAVSAYTQTTTNHSSFNVNPDDLRQYQIVIYTSIWESGISIEEHQKFDAVFGVFTGINTPDICYQMLSRVRCGCDRYVYAKRGAAFDKGASEKGAEYLRKLLSETLEEVLLQELEAERSLGVDNPLISAFADAMEMDQSINSKSILGQWQIANNKYEQATMAAYKDSIFGLSTIAGYTVIDYASITSETRMDQSINQEILKEFKKLSAELKLKNAQHVVSAKRIDKLRATAVQKGELATLEERSAAIKYPLEAATDGAVTLETVEEVLTFEQSGFMRGVHHCNIIVNNDRKAVTKQAINAIADQNHSVNYLNDNKRLKEAGKVKWVLDNLYPEVMALIEASANGEWGRNRDPETAYAKLCAKFASLFESYKAAFWTEGRGIVHAKVVNTLLVYLGFQRVMKRDNFGHMFQFKIPSHTARYLEWLKLQNDQEQSPS